MMPALSGKVGCYAIIKWVSGYDASIKRVRHGICIKWVNGA